MRKKRLLAILAIGERIRGELASELGISSQPWLSRVYLSPLMAQRYRLLRKGNIIYTVKHIQNSPTLFIKSQNYGILRTVIEVICGGQWEGGKK